METGDITLLYKKVLDLNIEQGIEMLAYNQKILICKRVDANGIFYSINDIVNDKVQKPYNDDDAMMLILLNKDRFIHNTYKAHIVTNSI